MLMTCYHVVIHYDRVSPSFNHYIRSFTFQTKTKLHMYSCWHLHMGCHMWLFLFLPPWMTMPANVDEKTKRLSYSEGWVDGVAGIADIRRIARLAAEGRWENILDIYEKVYDAFSQYRRSQNQTSMKMFSTFFICLVSLYSTHAFFKWRCGSTAKSDRSV